MGGRRPSEEGGKREPLLIDIGSGGDTMGAAKFRRFALVTLAANRPALIRQCRGPKFPEESADTCLVGAASSSEVAPRLHGSQRGQVTPETFVHFVCGLRIANPKRREKPGRFAKMPEAQWRSCAVCPCADGRTC